MPAQDPFALSKPCFDVGYFTNDLADMLAFWRDDMGLAFEEPVAFNDGLTQYRHALGNSVVKINTSREGVANPPTGYSELLIARPDCTAPREMTDPDGNRITLVPPGESGIEDVGIRVRVRNAETHRAFYTNVMRFEPVGDRVFRSGDSIVIVDQDRHAEPAGHWVNAGMRYYTLHVMRVDECFDAMTSAGAAVGERPYAIGDIARISFVRDPDGNWIEVAQRASLAGSWDA